MRNRIFVFFILALLLGSCGTSTGDGAYVGSNLNDAVLYQCRTNGTWTNTGTKVRNYMSVVVSGNITIGENGNWFSDGKDTGIPATPNVDEQLNNISNRCTQIENTIKNIQIIPETKIEQLFAYPISVNYR